MFFLNIESETSSFNSDFDLALQVTKKSIKKIISFSALCSNRCSTAN